MRSMRARLRLLLAATALFAVAAACGITEPNPQVTEQTFADTLGIQLNKYTQTASGLYLRDSVVGTGPTLANGQTVTIRYTGFFANGTVFERRVAPDSIRFKLGAGEAIAGIDQGLPGMKVGGKRMLIVPWELGYGRRGAGPIPPYAVLLFLVEAVRAE
jgi:FKBP-type peptidyl-prolyl cis-trans isomerase FkpA